MGNRLSIAWKIITGKIKTKPELDGKYTIKVNINDEIFKIKYNIDFIQDFTDIRNLKTLEDNILNSLKYYIELQNGYINPSIINNRIKFSINSTFRDVLKILDIEITKL